MQKKINENNSTSEEKGKWKQCCNLFYLYEAGCDKLKMQTVNRETTFKKNSKEVYLKAKRKDKMEYLKTK